MQYTLEYNDTVDVFQGTDVGAIEKAKLLALEHGVPIRIFKGMCVVEAVTVYNQTDFEAFQAKNNQPEGARV